MSSGMRKSSLELGAQVEPEICPPTWSAGREVVISKDSSTHFSDGFLSCLTCVANINNGDITGRAGQEQRR